MSRVLSVESSVMGTIRDGQPFEDKAYVQKPMCDAAHTSHRIRSDLERQDSGVRGSEDVGSLTFVCLNSVRYMEAKVMV